MGNRISYRDVLRHHANGRSVREIAAACYCSSSAVQDILARAKERDAGWDDVASLTDDEARKPVRGNPGGGACEFAAIDFERIDAEMARDRTMTLSILWEEYYALLASIWFSPIGTAVGILDQNGTGKEAACTVTSRES